MFLQCWRKICVHDKAGDWMTVDTSKEEMIYILKPAFFRSAPCNFNQLCSFLGRVSGKAYVSHSVFKLGAVGLQVCSQVGSLDSWLQQSYRSLFLSLTLSFCILDVVQNSSSLSFLWIQVLVNMSCTSVINLTYEDGSEGSPSNPTKFKNQDYAELKNTWRRRGRLFMDNTFAPESRSLGDLPDLNSWQEAQVQWLRPAVNIFLPLLFYVFFSYVCIYIWLIRFVFIELSRRSWKHKGLAKSLFSVRMGPHGLTFPKEQWVSRHLWFTGTNWKKKCYLKAWGEH